MRTIFVQGTVSCFCLGLGLFEPTNEFNIQGAARDIKNWCLLYFKRSYVKRRNGNFNGFLGYVKYKNVFPLSYPIAEAYVRTTLIPLLERELLIACTLRGSAGDPVSSNMFFFSECSDHVCGHVLQVRLRVRKWVEEYALSRGVKKFVAGEVSKSVYCWALFLESWDLSMCVTVFRSTTTAGPSSARATSASSIAPK